MVRFFYEYLGSNVLSGFDTYKYSCKDTSPLSKYVMHPFWDQVVKLCPMWVAPNLLTLVGFICCVGHFGLLTLYDYNYTSGTAPHHISKVQTLTEVVPVPGYVWFSVAILLFLSHTLDGIDGKQARRTGTSTPLGELFDHGLDSWATIFITASVYSIFGRNLDLFSISVFRMFCVSWNVYFCFLISHWEKYNTGILYLPWGYDFSMVLDFVFYMLTAVGGQTMWKIMLPGNTYPGPILEFLVYFGNVGITLPTALYNIWVSYREGTGKNRGFCDAMRPLVSTTIAMVMSFLWVLKSPNDILEVDPRCMYYLTGTIFANICCKLIIAQMSNTRCELFSVILYPTIVVCCVGAFANLTLQQELLLLYSFTGFATIAHVHYGMCVVSEIANHLGIKPFSIAKPGTLDNKLDTQRLLDNEEETVY